MQTKEINKHGHLISFVCVLQASLQSPIWFCASAMLHDRNNENILHKGPFTQAIFVAATRCNFCCAKVASSFKHV